MKKFKFSKLNLDDANILSREELKHVLGGDGYGGGGYGNGGCCWYVIAGQGYDPDRYCGLSAHDAEQSATNYAIQTGIRAGWCCASC